MKYPNIYRVLHIPVGAGFLPSTVLLDLSEKSFSRLGVPSWDASNEALEAELLSKTHPDGMADEGILPQARLKRPVILKEIPNNHLGGIKPIVNNEITYLSTG